MMVEYFYDNNIFFNLNNFRIIQLEVLWKKHGDYACLMQEQEEGRLEKEWEEDEDSRTEKQGALLFSYLQRDVPSFRLRKKFSINSSKSN